MNRMRIMGSQGDRQVVWDQEAAVAGDATAQAAVAEAERIFKAARGQGAVAFTVKEGEPGVRVDEWDPALEHVVMVPRMVGG